MPHQQPETPPQGDDSHEAVLKRAAQGDGDAWGLLVERYSGRLFALLLRQCGDRDLAEELTQATFVKIVTALSGTTYQERGRFEPWLFRIAMNKLRDEMRRRKRQAVAMDMGPQSGGGNARPGGWDAAQQQVIHGGPAPAQNPMELVSRDEQIDRLRQAIASMSQADQEVLQLRHTAALSFPQIAQVLGQPLGTVLARGHRALAKLKKLMAEPDLKKA